LELSVAFTGAAGDLVMSTVTAVPVTSVAVALS